MSKQLKPNEWIDYSIYMNQINVKIYELNMQNTKQLLIQQNDVLNKKYKKFYIKKMTTFFSYHLR